MTDFLENSLLVQDRLDLQSAEMDKKFLTAKLKAANKKVLELNKLLSSHTNKNRKASSHKNIQDLITKNKLLKAANAKLHHINRGVQGFNTFLKKEITRRHGAESLLSILCHVKNPKQMTEEGVIEFKAKYNIKLSEEVIKPRIVTVKPKAKKENKIHEISIELDFWKKKVKEKYGPKDYLCFMMDDLNPKQADAEGEENFKRIYNIN